jgi:hypothetical protein
LNVSATPLYLAQQSARSYDRWSVNSGGTEALIAIEPWGRCVAFRGTTSDFGDILRDLRAVPWYDKDLGWCHSGFLKGAREIYPLLRPALHSGPLWLTGHSLGGALATLVAAMMVRDGIPLTGLVTFGCPRVGYGLEERLKAVPFQQRWVHGTDCVPSHPWTVWGYRHARWESWLPLCEDEEADRFLNHRMASYVSAIS